MRITYHDNSLKKVLDEQKIKYYASLLALDGIFIEEVEILNKGNRSAVEMYYITNKNKLVIAFISSNYFHSHINYGWKQF